MMETDEQIYSVFLEAMDDWNKEAADMAILKYRKIVEAYRKSIDSLPSDSDDILDAFGRFLMEVDPNNKLSKYYLKDITGTDGIAYPNRDRILGRAKGLADWIDDNLMKLENAGSFAEFEKFKDALIGSDGRAASDNGFLKKFRKGLETLITNSTGEIEGGDEKTLAMKNAALAILQKIAMFVFKLSNEIHYQNPNDSAQRYMDWQRSEYAKQTTPDYTDLDWQTAARAQKAKRERSSKGKNPYED